MSFASNTATYPEHSRSFASRYGAAVRREPGGGASTLEAENAALVERLTRLRVALERLIADNVAARREVKRLHQENRRLREQLVSGAGH